MLWLLKMNKNNCGTGNEQSVDCTQMTEWSSTDYQLSNSLTTKKVMMVRDPFKIQNGKNWYKKPGEKERERERERKKERKEGKKERKRVLQQGNILDVNCICGNI